MSTPGDVDVCEPDGTGWMSVKNSVPHFGQKVDAWLYIYASPRSMGWADAFRVVDCWRTEDGKWVHHHGGEVAELYAPYVTHWMPTPKDPR